VVAEGGQTSGHEGVDHSGGEATACRTHVAIPDTRPFASPSIREPPSGPRA
jgi:hypothetical protein